MSLASRLKHIFFPQKERDPEAAYDLWSAGYDDQPGNLMLDLDEILFSNLLSRVTVKGKSVVDIGCGTGRHWRKILDLQPHSLCGYDVSAGMLEKLAVKFPDANTYLLRDTLLAEQGTASCDLLVSTLAVAHMEELENVFAGWNRILKPGASVIITDYHPLALTKGGKRTFTHKGKTIMVKNHIHPLEKVRRLAGQLGWAEIRFMQRCIDDSVKEYYERQNALALFESFRNVPVIYGIHLKKKDGTE